MRATTRKTTKIVAAGLATIGLLVGAAGAASAKPVQTNDAGIDRLKQLCTAAGGSYEHWEDNIYGIGSFTCYLPGGATVECRGVGGSWECERHENLSGPSRFDGVVVDTNIVLAPVNARPGVR